MDEFDPAKGWHYRKTGQWENALRAETFDIGRYAGQPQPFIGRGICHLALGRIKEAAEDFARAKTLQKYGGVSAHSVFLGLAYWWMKRPEEACEQWQEALNAQYLQLPGIPILGRSLLFFVSKRCPGLYSEQKAVELLRQTWRPELSKNWPAPILGFLLGEMDEETFLNGQKFSNPVLEARRLARANFWTGALAFSSGDTTKYDKCLRAAASEPPEAAVTNEAEHWLAKAELELLFNNG